MKKLKFLITGLLAVMLIVSSCKKEDTKITNSDNKDNLTAQQSDGIIVLGNQLEDPYAIKNMKKAYSNLKSANSETPDVDIQPTHVYLRFLPQNNEEWSVLKQDTNFVLYDYPLNYQIVVNGTYYHDPSLSDSSITYQYAVIKKGIEIPDVKHELLYDVFIPPIEDSTSTTTKSAKVLRNCQ